MTAGLALIFMSGPPTTAQQSDAAAEDAPTAGARASLTYVVIDGAGVPERLSDEPADPERGRALFFAEGPNGCAQCHSLGDAGAQDGLSPLDGVGARLSQAALRLWIVNPRVLRDDPGMPAYFSFYPMGDEAAPAAAPLLSGQEIEDLVAFLNAEGGRAP